MVDGDAIRNFCQRVRLCDIMTSLICRMHCRPADESARKCNVTNEDRTSHVPLAATVESQRSKPVKELPALIVKKKKLFSHP